MATITKDIVEMIHSYIQSLKDNGKYKELVTDVLTFKLSVDDPPKIAGRHTKNGNIVIYKDNDTFILDADKNEKLTDEQLQEIANKINKGVEDGRAED